MPTTLRLRASDPRDIERAAEILRVGGTVAFPTETVYGLGANALSAGAVAGIFAAKQRPSWDPLIVHVPTLNEALQLVMMDLEVSRRVEALAQRFWPGPLTLLLPRRSHVPDAVTAGRALVGVRVPAHPAAQALLRAARLPLAAPSANLFGHTSPTTAQHVLEDLDGRIDAVLDGGPANIGLESSVLDATVTPMILYRPGALTPAELAEVVGVSVMVFAPDTTANPLQNLSEAATQAALPAPGVGLRHYAPRARLILVDGNPEALRAALAHSRDGAQVGVMLPDNWFIDGCNYLVQPWAAWNEPDRLASLLFSVLRSLDSDGAEIIFCPLPAPGGLNDAIRDRLQKASRTQ